MLASSEKPLLQAAKKHIQEIYIPDLRYLIWLAEEPEEWKKICFRKSHLEAFNAMFGEIIGILNLDVIEEEMQDIKHKFI